jgi:pilus assembly protein Flp/PilA
MSGWTWPRDLLTRITSTYLSIAETSRRPLDRSRAPREDGQGMVEYALILVLIAVVVVLVLTTVGHQVKNIFSNLSSGLGT